MFENFYLKIKLLSNTAKMPTRGTPGSAGLDFFSPKTFFVPPNSDTLISLEVAVEFPVNYVLLLIDKSSITVKKKLEIGAGCIDSDYRGPVHAHIINRTSQTVGIKQGEKICQGIIVPVWFGTPTQVSELSTTIRAGKGFGSTGVF